MPLDVARTAFEWLVTGPHPVSVDGRQFRGMPARQVPLDELRDRLLRRSCPQRVRDAVWAHLVSRSRAEGATWTVGCVGVALPALTRIAATLSARFAGDPSDVHAAVLSGFVAELARIDLRTPRIMLRLRWAAYRAGHECVREALDAPVPIGDGFRSTAPRRPWGHPDFVLARAVADGIVTPAEAELIGSTRLEDVPLATAAQRRGVSYEAAKKTRQRAEHRLTSYLLDNHTESGAAAGGDPAAQVADVVTIADAAREATAWSASASSQTGRDARARKEIRPRVSPRGPENGVQGHRRNPPSPRTRPPSRPGPRRRTGNPRCPSPE
jgi:hypothetical protein